MLASPVLLSQGSLYNANLGVIHIPRTYRKLAYDHLFPTFKVLHLLGRRPLLRTGICDYCLVVRHSPVRWANYRFQSTWMQETDEIARDTGTRRLSGRVHILGLGNVGTFIAHSLASRQSPPPMTLLLHNINFYRAWIARKESLSVKTNGLDDIKTGFDINLKGADNIWYSMPYWGEDGSTNRDERLINERASDTEIEQALETAGEDDSIIECLIVAVKAPQTVVAVESVRHRLTRDSTILIVQNGMGTRELLDSEVFPDPENRPHYMVGVFSHGLVGKFPFQAVHTGVGTAILSPAPTPGSTVSLANEDNENWAPSTKYLLRTLTLTPALVAVTETPSSILQYQLEKLAMNAVINPLTAIMNCKNGELLYNFEFTRVARLLLIEICSVVCALPELQGIPGIEARFSPERLRNMVVQLANKTSQNSSSMLQDLTYKRQSEIEAINGYIVRRGEELGIKCVVNYTVKELVHARQKMLRQREARAIPIDVTGLELDDS